MILLAAFFMATPFLAPAKAHASSMYDELIQPLDQLIIGESYQNYCASTEWRARDRSLDWYDIVENYASEEFKDAFDVAAENEEGWIVRQNMNGMQVIV